MTKERDQNKEEKPKKGKEEKPKKTGKDENNISRNPEDSEVLRGLERSTGTHSGHSTEYIDPETGKTVYNRMQGKKLEVVEASTGVVLRSMDIG